MKKVKGNIAETAVIHYLSKLGLPVFKEIGDSVSVDLITIINKKPIMIQVKYAEIDSTGAVSLSVRKTGPNNYIYYYKEDDFDIFALYVADTEQIIWISVKEALLNKNVVSFRQTVAKNNQKTRMISDYLNIFNALNYIPVLH